MKSTFRTQLMKAFVASAFILFGLLSVNQLNAQPTNYCKAFCNPPHTTCYCYNSYAYFTDVRMTDVATGEVVLERQSGQENCYKFVNDREAKLTPGETYRLYLRRYNMSYYNYTRVYIDWNIDGDWFDRGLFTDPTVNETVWRTRLMGYSTYFAHNINITVPTDIEPGKTRMRLITNYYYDYGPCVVGYSVSNSINYGYGEAEDYILNFEAALKDTYPSTGDILYANERYDGVRREKDGVMEDFQKPSIVFAGPQPAGAICYYYISGPLPSTNEVYRGYDPNPPYGEEFDAGGTGSAVVPLRRSGGVCSYPSPTGDGTFVSERGGVYKVTAYLLGSPLEKMNMFTVSWDNDLAVSGVVSPRTDKEPQFFKYLRGQTIKVSAIYQNVGLKRITEFDALAVILNSDGDTVYTSEVHYDTTNPAQATLLKGEKTELEFNNFRTSNVGIYELWLHASLLSAIDEDDYNDHLARQGELAYTFEIAHEIQLMANQVFNPEEGETLIGSRPIIPTAEFKNVGIGDASDVPAKMVVRKLPDMNTVYESDIIVEDVPSGKYNTKTVFFDEMAILESGDYECCIVISAEEDIVPEDDTLCITFSVEAGLSGVYTVGTTESGDRNFDKVEDAMDAMYYRGIVGPVVFEMTDAVYNIEGEMTDAPAWDFRSRIIGLGYDADNERYNTISWKPSRARAVQRGGITINLYAPNGKGVQFGQALFPANEYAIVNEFGNPKNANSAGHIKFDGGLQKTFKFVLHSSSDYHGAAFYLDRGSKNITVANCLIENGTPAIDNRVWTPLVTYHPQLGYGFDPDTLVADNNDGYSAGVVVRSSLYKLEEVEFLKLDTIPNAGNIVDNNEITSFGYGIASFGIGVLYLQNEARYERFYNTNNRYSNNTIHDIARAGILLGFEENSEVSGNRIYDIGNGSLDAAGVMVGGGSRDGFDGYNNIKLKIVGNEVSGIQSPSMVHGIRIEQVRNTFQDPILTVVHYPNVDEGMLVANNNIWGLEPLNSSAMRAGIHLYTERANASDLVTPMDVNYATRKDMVVNNTVIISDDGGMVNRGDFAGIALQQTKGAYLYNNAIAIEDNSLDGNNLNGVAAAVLYHGLKPEAGGIAMDRNAFWLGNTNTTIYRYIETDESANILEAGERDEFVGLGQWQTWTGQSKNSVVGDFTQDLDFYGNEPRELRVVTEPETPIGSILNNRGERVGAVTADIDDVTRGAAGQRYDIGACEFTGRMYVSDIEMLTMPSPGAYKSGSGLFKDAEYIMTEAPVEVKTYMRNNGSLQQSDIDVNIKIYRETPSGTYEDSTIVVDETVKASVASTESIELAFNLADGLGADFVPESYGDLRYREYDPVYNIPAHFKSMEANVTPRYKIVIEAESDQHNYNNKVEKEVRFYLKKTGMSLLLSSENSMVNMYTGTPGVNEIAGCLNSDSLRQGLQYLGWFTNVDSNRYDYDLFERKGWEPRSVNYTMYRTMFWTDGDDVEDNGTNELTRYEIIDVKGFLDSYIEGQDKKNLLIGSQEIVRENDRDGDMYVRNRDFVHEVLRAEYVSPGNPLGFGGDNNGNSVTGVWIGKDLVSNIRSTDMPGDEAPYCGLMSIWPIGNGLAREAFYYNDHGLLPDSTVGIATTSLESNIIVLGVDWRHWADIEHTMRGVFDFVEKFHGKIVPIELSAFDAKARGRQVNLTWQTSSELNSARFDIEKASDNGVFTKIDELAAAGKSETAISYGPVVDYSVDYGQTYVYRLKMVDLDGQFDYSEEKTVTIDGAEGGVSLGQAMPNPANDMTRFELTLSNEMNLEMVIYDMGGKKVATVLNGSKGQGTYSLDVDLSDLSSGAYTLVLRSGDVVITRQIKVVKGSSLK